MSDLIRREDIINAVTTPEKFNGYNLYPPSHGELLDRLNNIPAVDAVPVVRCGQCMFSDWFVRRGGGKYCYCLKTGARMYGESDFCSYGRREEEDT